MAKALQCPTCGTKHPVSALPDAATFHCRQCGQALKIPPGLRTTSAAVSSGSPADAEAGTAVMPVAGGDAAAATVRPGRVPRPTRTSPSERLQRLPLLLRALAWIVAVPLGLIIVVIPARSFGWLSGDRLVDVFTTGEGFSRYFKPRVLLLAPVWALATTALLTLFIEGGRWLADKRRAVKAERAAANRDESLGDGQAPSPADRESRDAAAAAPRRGPTAARPGGS